MYSLLLVKYAKINLNPSKWYKIKKNKSDESFIAYLSGLI